MYETLRTMWHERVFFGCPLLYWDSDEPARPWIDMRPGPSGEWPSEDEWFPLVSTQALFRDIEKQWKLLGHRDELNQFRTFGILVEVMGRPKKRIITVSDSEAGCRRRQRFYALGDWKFHVERLRLDVGDWTPAQRRSMRRNRSPIELDTRCPSPLEALPKTAPAYDEKVV